MNEKYHLIAIVAAAFLIIAAILALTVGVLWLGWLGGWYGVAAVVFANFIGSVQGVYRDKR